MGQQDRGTRKTQAHVGWSVTSRDLPEISPENYLKIMDAETYAQWLRGQGQQVVRTASTYWHSEGLRVYQAFPYHRLIVPSTLELSEMFYQHRAIALRYCTPEDSAEGCPSYSIVFENDRYDLDVLGYRTRKNVRRGLRNCHVEAITFRRLADEGWLVRTDALERQGRRLTVTRDLWRKRYLSAADLPGFQAWGATVGDHLAGYIVTFRMGECLCIIDQQSHRDYLNLNVNNALTFVVSQDAVRDPDVKLVFYGHESLDAPPRVTEFKLHMGYEAKAVRQCIKFHPFVSPFVNPLLYFATRYAATAFPKNRALSKAAGMLRFCLAEKNGLRPRTANLKSSA